MGSSPLRLFDRVETGEHRRARIDDWRELAILVDALPNIDVVATLHCGDVPQATADLHSFRVLLESQRNCIVHNAFSLENLHVLLEMAIAVRGSREALAARPLVHLQALADLTAVPQRGRHRRRSSLAMRVRPARSTCRSCRSPASRGPITFAGTLAQANAEYLGTVILAQSAHPGYPIGRTSSTRLSVTCGTATPSFAAPETALLVAAISQLSREVYGLPAQAIGLDADGFSLSQIMFQKAQNCLMQAMAGGKLIIGAGSVEGRMALSPRMLVVDDQIVAIARRWVRGFEVNDETLALDVLERVGPRGDFLADDHTVDHLYSGELLPSSSPSTEAARRGRRAARGRSRQTRGTRPGC